MNEPVKRPVGRPRKNVEPKVEAPKQEPKRQYKMRSKPNWEDTDPNAEASVDRLKLPRGFQDKYPDLAFQWIEDSVLGQPDPQRRGEYERNGWTPIHPDDFDGELDGVFMKKGDTAEINVGGLVLMAMPREGVEKARARDRRLAREQVMIKEQALRGGDLPVSLDSRHPSAVGSNRITKSVERIEVPEK